MQNHDRVRFMTRVALLVALSIAIRRFITPPLHGLNLGGLPLVVAGFVLGPCGGACVGALSDVVGVAFSPYSYLPFYTMTAALTGAVPVLVYRALGKRSDLRSVAICIAAGQLLTKGVLIPLFEHDLTGVPTFILVLKAVPVQILHVPLYTVVVLPILRVMTRHTE